MSEGEKPRFLLVVSYYYREIVEQLVAGAVAKLAGLGGDYDSVTVPGALEIPAAIAMADEAGTAGGHPYDGYVALGCVIRGETSHYDIVAQQSARALMDLAILHGLAVGNGILTVDSFQQAWARARQRDKGGDAAHAAFAMAALKRRLRTAPSAGLPE